MEADRGQANIATVLSVGVHTSPCTGPGLDPITQTHTHTGRYLIDSGVGGHSSCSPAVAWDPEIQGVS